MTNAKAFVRDWRHVGLFPAIRTALDGQSHANRDLFPKVFGGS